MIYFCDLRHWSQICATFRCYWFLDLVAPSCCAGARCLGSMVWLHTYEMDTGNFPNPNLSAVLGKFDKNLCVPELYYRTFYCLLTSMATVHAEMCMPLFWLWVIWTASSGAVGFYDHELSWCISLWFRSVRLWSVGRRLTHARSTTLSCLMTDVPDCVQIDVVAPIGNSDYSSVAAVI